MDGRRTADAPLSKQKYKVYSLRSAVCGGGEVVLVDVVDAEGAPVVVTEHLVWWLPKKKRKQRPGWQLKRH